MRSEGLCSTLSMFGRCKGEGAKVTSHIMANMWDVTFSGRFPALTFSGPQQQRRL